MARSDQGYGVKRVNYVLRYAHVLAWEAAHGPVPSGHEVHHRCANRACVNVDHLVVLTPAKHMQTDRAKLTQCEVDEIRRRAHAGELQKHLAEEFGVSRPHVSRLVRGLKWRP